MQSKLASLVVLLSSGAIASPVVQSNPITVLYRSVKNGPQGISAFTSDGALISSACASSLNSDGFPIAISVSDSDFSRGTISVGSSTFTLTSAPADETVPECSRMYGANFVEVECLVTAPPNWTATSSTGPAASCFQGTPFAELSPNATWLNPHPNEIATVDGSQSYLTGDGDSAGLSRRVAEPQSCSNILGTQLVGNGNPHQNYFNKQLTHNQVCDPTHSCSVGVTESTTTTFSFTANGKLNDWISGGFSVAKGSSFAETHTCNGNPGETLCVWIHEAYTAYTVQNYVDVVCPSYTTHTVSPNKIILKSPNENDVGTDIYCVNGASYCRSIGQGYWDNSGRAGGP